MPRRENVTLFNADSPTVTRVVPSANRNVVRIYVPSILVLHYTGMKTGDAALERMCDPAAEVSSHYLVYEDGRIDQLVPESQRAWHAGVSSWAGERNVNSHSLGIEIVNPGHANGYPDFAEAGIAATITLCQDIIKRHQLIRADRVVAHSDIAPRRKQDPGEKFPWKRFADAGVGLWIEPVPISDGPALAPGDQGKEVEQLQMMFARYGYGAEITRIYDALTWDIVAAFQRHFRPARVDGIADRSTIETLRRLLTASSAIA